jgi:hypothetical protein
MASCRSVEKMTTVVVEGQEEDSKLDLPIYCYVKFKHDKQLIIRRYNITKDDYFTSAKTKIRNQFGEAGKIKGKWKLHLRKHTRSCLESFLNELLQTDFDYELNDL